jgi:hypothetical protein
VLPGMFKTGGHDRRRLARNFDSESSPFKAISRRALAKVESIVAKNAAPPEPVAELVVALLSDTSPPGKVRIGSEAQVQRFVRTLLPASAWERLVRRTLGFEADA